MIKRVFFDIGLLFLVIILPWWASLLILFLGIFIFNDFYEFIVASTIIYIMYSAPTTKIISSPYFFPIIIFAIYFGLQFIKSNIILYKNEI